MDSENPTSSFRLDPVTNLLNQSARSRSRRAHASAGEVPDGIDLLISELNLPAFVLGPFLNVAASNSLAKALGSCYRPGSNLLRAVFLDPAARKLHLDWENVAEHAVSSLRRSIGDNFDDPGLIELVGELSLRSDDFSQIWARHNVVPHDEPVRLEHPQVGTLELLRESLSITNAPAMTLVIYHAQPGSASADALARLDLLPASSHQLDRTLRSVVLS